VSAWGACLRSYVAWNAYSCSAIAADVGEDAVADGAGAGYCGDCVVDAVSGDLLENVLHQEMKQTHSNHHELDHSGLHQHLHLPLANP